MWRSLEGYKSYFVAACAVAYAVGGYITGQLDLNTAIAFALGGSGLGALRHGFTTQFIGITERLAPIAVAMINEQIETKGK